MGSLARLQRLPEKPEPEAAAGWSYTPLSSVLGTHFSQAPVRMRTTREPTFEKERRAFRLSQGTPAWDLGSAETQAGGVGLSGRHCRAAW